MHPLYWVRILDNFLSSPCTSATVQGDSYWLCIITSLTSIMSKPFLLGNDKYFISAAVIRLWLDLIDILRVMLLNPSLSPVCTKMFTHKIHYAEHILKNTQPWLISLFLVTKHLFTRTVWRVTCFKGIGRKILRWWETLGLMSCTDMVIKIRIWDCFVIADFTVK